MPRNRRKEPLYRKVNTRIHGVRHGGGDDRHDRKTKTETQNDAARGSMPLERRHGLDDTPLFRFLSSRVGRDRDAVYSEAVARLDREEPIWWLVARLEADRQPCFRVGDSSCFSGLFVDEDNLLRKVDPTLGSGSMTPRCPCCTHSFNGRLFTRRYPPAEPKDIT